MRLVLVVAVLMQCAGAAAGGCPVKPVDAQGVPEVPGGDIFGFLNPADIGEACSFGFASETTGRVGKRDGRYVATTTKSQLAYTWSEQLAFAISPFVSAFSWKDVAANRAILLTTGMGVDRASLDVLDFDGVSVEASWRVLQRSAGQPLAITLSTEPRWFLRAPVVGHAAEGRQIELKLLADIALRERWFAAVNLVYGLGVERLALPGAELVEASALVVASALTWQAYRSESGTVQGVFVGAEVRYTAGFSGLALDVKAGDALFAGPTLAIAFKNGTMLNVAWSPQAWGRGRPASAPGSLDLDTFERHQLRIKLAAPL